MSIWNVFHVIGLKYYFGNNNMKVWRLIDLESADGGGLGCYIDVDYGI